MLWQHQQLSQDQRQFAIAGLVEGEGHFARRGDFGRGDIGIVLRAVRIDLDQLLEGPDHVFGRHRFAVVPFGIRIHAEGHSAIIRGDLQRLGQMHVIGVILVQRGGHQRLVEEPDATCHFALGQDGIEGIEPAEIAQPHGATLGRVDIDIVEIGVVEPIFGLAFKGEGIDPGVGWSLRLGRWDEADSKTTDGKERGELEGQRHGVAPIGIVDQEVIRL